MLSVPLSINARRARAVPALAVVLLWTGCQAEPGGFEPRSFAADGGPAECATRHIDGDVRCLPRTVCADDEYALHAPTRDTGRVCGAVDWFAGFTRDDTERVSRRKHATWFDSPGEDDVLALAETPDGGVFVAGHYARGLILTKLAADGRAAWSGHVPTGGGIYTDIPAAAVNPAGDIYFLVRSMSEDRSELGTVLASFRTDGSPIAFRDIPSRFGVLMEDLAIGEGGEVFAVGRTRARVPATGTEEVPSYAYVAAYDPVTRTFPWTYTFTREDAPSTTLTAIDIGPNGRLYASGGLTEADAAPGPFASSPWLLSLSADGDTPMHRTFRRDASARAVDILVTALGEVNVIGWGHPEGERTPSSPISYLDVFDAELLPMRANILDLGDATVRDLALRPDGLLSVAGAFAPLDGEFGTPFVATLSGDPAPRATITEFDDGARIRTHLIRGDGSLLLGGSVVGPAFGAPSVSGPSDGFVAAIAPR